tara:strand:- start:275 stop:523 length:249 start_codon:yes stop_codon:yes gene_type:complete
MIIKYFAWVKNITGKDQEIINEKIIIDINTLKIFLIKKYPKLKKYFNDKKLIRFAVNLNYEIDNKKLNQNDEIAIFPPVSGG